MHPVAGDLAALFSGFASPDIIEGNRRTSRVPVGPLCRHAPLSDPGGHPLPSPLAGKRFLPSDNGTSSATTINRYRGSITQPVDSLFTLRSGGYPSATQNSLPGGWLHLSRTGLPPVGTYQQISRRHLLPPIPLLPASPAHSIVGMVLRVKSRRITVPR